MTADSSLPDKLPGRTATGARKASAKSARTRAREFALQALYQHLVGRNDAPSIDTFTRDLAGFHKADTVHYDALLHGCIQEAAEQDELIVPLLDRWVFGVSRFDPVTFVSVAAVLCLTTALAALGPAIRASRWDPMASLRAE